MTIDQLKMARKQLKLTSTQMAKVLGYASYRQYYRLENGDREISATIKILVNALLILANTKHSDDFNLNP